MDLDGLLFHRCLKFAEHLAPLYHQSSPPYTLVEIVENLGIHDVRERLLDRNARLVLQDGRPIIEVNSLFPPRSRRFSVAHEIGHVIVNLSAGRERFQKSCGDQTEESLCDRIAEILLTPNEAIRRFFFTTEQELKSPLPQCMKIFAAARAFGVSVEAIIRRVFLDIALGSSGAAMIWRQRLRAKEGSKEPLLTLSRLCYPKHNRLPAQSGRPAKEPSIVISALKARGPVRRKEALSLGPLQGTYQLEAAAFTSAVELDSFRSRCVLSVVDTR